MRSQRISALGKALSDPNRAEILCVLHSGRARTAGELAAHVGLAPSTTSRHLAELVDRGLVVVEPSGRHRYFRLRSHEISDLLGVIDTMDLPHPSAAVSRRNTGIAVARTCYDHAAGALGVGIFRSMTRDGLLDLTDDGPRLTALGHARLRSLGVDTQHLGTLRRPLVRACLDWEQQTHHLGGSAAGALLRAMLERGWLARRGEARILTVTDLGARNLDQHFQVVIGRAIR